MAEDPNLDLPEIEEEGGYSWVIIVAVVAAFAVIGFWIWHAKNAPAPNGIEQQLFQDKAQVDAARDKIFELTNELDVLKARISAGQVPDKAKAVADYNKLAAEQRAQRETMKKLADEYNAKLEKFQNR